MASGVGGRDIARLATMTWTGIVIFAPGVFITFSTFFCVQKLAFFMIIIMILGYLGFFLQKIRVVMIAERTCA